MSASSKKKLRKEQNAAAMTARQKQEKSAAKELTVLTVTFVLILAFFVVAFIGAFVVPPIITSIDNYGFSLRNTTAVTVGEHKLNAVTFNYYFRDTINSEYNKYQSTYGESTDTILNLMGLDLSKPLDEQVKDQESGETWYAHFLHTALDSAKSDYALYDAANAAGYTAAEEDLVSVDNALMTLQFYSQMSGISVNDYLIDLYGRGASEESYKQYLTVSATAASFYNDKLASVDYTDEQLREYEADRYAEYSSFTYAVYDVKHSAYLGEGTKDDAGTVTYTDEETLAAREAAEADALSLGTVTGKEALDAAIAELAINAEAETKPTSTLHEDLLYSSLSLTDEQKQWLTAAERTGGEVKVFPVTTTEKDADGKETEVVNTYRVMVFVSANENKELMSNVRHILVNFEGGTTTTEGVTTYTEEEKATAYEAAEKLLQQWKDGDATEDSFAKLATEHTDDTGSQENGGLYENVNRYTNFVENFLNWSISDDRKAGDTEIVESPYGYHIMYYVGDSELTLRDFMITNEKTAEDMEAWQESLTKEITVTENDLSMIDMVYAPAQ